MKTTIMISSIIMLVCGLCLCSGVDSNPIQAIYALPFFGVGSYLFSVWERMGESARKNERKPRPRVYDYQRGTFVDAA